MTENKDIYLKQTDVITLLRDFALSEDISKVFESTTYYTKANSEDLFNAFHDGILWAAILIGGSTEIQKYLFPT